MKSIKIVFLLFIISSYCFSKDKIIPSNKLTQGVYCLENQSEKMIIELKKGKYSYWYNKIPLAIDKSFPVLGKYELERNMLTIPIDFCEENRCIYIREDWYIFLVNGVPTLWNDTALKNWKDNKIVDNDNILYLTPNTPKELWESH